MNEFHFDEAICIFSLRVDKDGETFTCGGSLIDSRRILTAAHCVVDHRNDQKISPKNVRPYLGIQSVNEVDEIIKPAEVSHYEIHPKFPNNGYDIALLVLKEPVKFTKTISPICIRAFESDSNFQNKKLTVVGWGINDVSPDEDDQEKMVEVSPEIPMEAEVDFVSREYHFIPSTIATFEQNEN